MNEQVKNFIEENINLIEKRKWEQIYNKDFPEHFTETLLECGINPLEQGLNYIPNDFLLNSNIKEFIIPDNVKSIGSCAFYGCRLTQVTIGNSVTNIGDQAFSWCGSLASIEIPNSVTSIGDGAFRYCSSLTNVIIGNSVTSIGEYAFYNCKSLTSVTIGNSVTSIGYNAFGGYSRLKNVYYVGDINNWAQIAFSIHANPACIANDLYINNQLVTEARLITATKISDYAFSNYKSLTSVIIGDSVTMIGNHAFYSCISLTNIEIPDSVVSIGEEAFYNCKSLTSINYAGPKKKAVKLGIGNRSRTKWRMKSAIRKIICTDGIIDL